MKVHLGFQGPKAMLCIDLHCFLEALFCIPSGDRPLCHQQFTTRSQIPHEIPVEGICKASI